MRLSCVRLAFLVAALLPFVSLAEDITISLRRSAKVTGSVVTNARGEKVNVFRGIRYAEPALGANRFKPTVAIKPTGAINATSFGSMCWTDSRYDAVAPYPQSEDCLFINVYAPAGANVFSNLPVMVWTHGGAYVAGDGARYDGRNLVGSGGNNVIYVSFNYRLGLFGFLANQQLLKEGNGANAALRDMQLAYEWVGDNIRYFGGNPNDVTAFGESAGAFMIALQMLTNNGNQQIFDRAILESGAYPSYSQVMTVAEQDTYISTLASKVNCANSDAAKVLACLRTVDAATLIAAGGNMDWRPIVDNKFLTDVPYNLVKKGKISNIPTIFGTNTVEGYLFSYNVQTEDQFNLFINYGIGLNAAEIAQVLTLYPASSFASPHFRAGELLGDAIFVCPSERMTEAIAGVCGAPTYHYRFNESVYFGDVIPLATHTVEMRYVFNDTSVGTDAASLQLAANVGKFWTNFARYESPNGAIEGWFPLWPRYTTTAKKQIVLQKQITTEKNGAYLPGHAERCAFWETVEARKASTGGYLPTVSLLADDL